MEELHLNKQTSYDQTTDQPKQLEIFKATTGRRVLSFFCDAICVLLLFIILQSTIVSLVVNKAFDFDTKRTTLMERELDSHLFEAGIYNGETYDCLTLNQSFDKESGVAFDHYHEKIVYFYTNFSALNDDGKELIDIKNYYKEIQESNLFDVTGDYNSPETFSATPKSDVEESQMREFYQNTAYQSALDALAYDEVILPIQNSLLTAHVIQILVSCTLSSIVFLLVVPMCNKKGQTLGMMFMKTAVVNRANGFQAKKTQVLIRFLILFLFEGLLSVFILGLPALISFTMMMFSKENNSLHDYFSASIVVDLSRTRIFKNEQEFLDYVAKEEEAKKSYTSSMFTSQLISDQTSVFSSEKTTEDK